MLDIHKAMSLAFVYLCVGVDKAKALPGKPSVPFNDLEQRFWQRFRRALLVSRLNVPRSPRP